MLFLVLMKTRSPVEHVCSLFREQLICECCKTNIVEPGIRYCSSCAAKKSSESATEEYPCSVCSQVGGGRLEHGSWVCRKCDHGESEATCLVCRDPENLQKGPLLRSECGHGALAHGGCLNNGVLRCRDVHFVDSQGTRQGLARCVPQEQTVQTLITSYTTNQYLEFCDEIIAYLLYHFGVAVSQQDLVDFLAEHQRIPVNQISYQAAQHFLPLENAAVIEQRRQQVLLRLLSLPPVQSTGSRARQRYRCSIM